MRIANIVRKENGLIAEEGEKKSAKKTSPPRKTSSPSRATQVPPPPPPPKFDAEEIKESLREDLEGEFHSKLQEIETRLEEQYAEKLKEKEAQLKRKAVEVHEYEKKLENRARQIDERVQREVDQRVKEQVSESVEKAPKEPVASDDDRSREVQALKRTLKTKEEQLRLKEAQLKKQLEKGQAPPESSKPPEKRTPPPPPPAKLPSDAPAKSKKAKVPPMEFGANRVEHQSDELAAKAEILRRQKRLEILKQQQVEYSKMLEEYQQIAKLGDELLQKIADGKHANINVFKDCLKKIIALAKENDGDLIGIAQQPYPEERYFHYHATNCMILGLAIGLDLKMDDEALFDLCMAIFFHDVALTNIQEDLNYPKELSDAIKKEVREHPERSAQMMGDMISEEAKLGILQHHETCDGRGYPQALKSDDICLFGKIAGIVDAFEAMTHVRPYRSKAVPVSEAMKQIVERNRHSYDREVLKALMGRVGLYPVMSLVELSNKQIARVIRQNKKFPLSPVVTIEFDEWGHKLTKTMVVDLSESKLIHVLGSLEEVDSFQVKRMEKHSDVKSELMGLAAKFVPMVLGVIFLAAIFYIILKV